MMIDTDKRSKTLNEIKPIKNICKSPEKLNVQLNIHMQKEGLVSHKFRDCGFYIQNAFQSKKVNPLQTNYYSQLNLPNLSHIKQEYT